MSDTTLGARQDPRRRNLTILGGVTALFVLLAILAVWQQNSALAPKFEQRPFFPGLGDKLGQLGEIAVTSKTGTFHVKLAGGKWAVTEKGGFPADAAQVRAVAVG